MTSTHVQTDGHPTGARLERSVVSGYSRRRAYPNALGSDFTFYGPDRALQFGMGIGQ